MAKTMKSEKTTETITPAAARKLTPETRQRLIAEAAYYRAERRGFGGDPLADWLEAEADIDMQPARRD